MIVARRTHLLLLLCFASAPLHAQGLVGGMLVDPRLKKPLPCVDVALEDSAAHEVAHARTASDGAFQFDAPAAGSYRLHFNVWSHAPAFTPYETLDSTSQRARMYEIDFGPESPMNPQQRADSADAPPGRPLHLNQVPDLYPLELRSMGLEGDVTVQFVQDSTGKVVFPSIEVLQASRPEFAAAVVRYLRLAQFEPVRRGGHPVCALVMGRNFSFRLGR